MAELRTVSVDSSVLLDIVLPEAADRETSRRALNLLAQRGALVVSPVVVSEVAAQYEQRQSFSDFFDGKPFRVVPDDREVSWWASRFFRRYTRSRNVDTPRKKILPDFFIAAHAYVHSDVLLTRDADFQKSYFEEVRTTTPGNVLKK